jgi:hypothetical protein
LLETEQRKAAPQWHLPVQSGTPGQCIILSPRAKAMTESADRETDTAKQAQTPDAGDQNDIYGEDGSIRQDYLAAVGAAIADRDVLFLREQVVPCMNRNLATCWRRSPPPSARHWSRCWAMISISPR